MGHFSVEIYAPPGSPLNANRQATHKRLARAVHSLEWCHYLRYPDQPSRRGQSVINIEYESITASYTIQGPNGGF